MADRQSLDLVILAEQEAEKAADFERIAELGALAAAEAAAGAEQKRMNSPALTPLARLAAKKSQAAAVAAAESSRIVDDLGSTVREEVGTFAQGGEPYDLSRVPRVDRASSRACTSSEMARASAVKAVALANRAESVLLSFEEEEAKRRQKAGRGGVLTPPARTVRQRNERPPASAPAVPAAGTGKPPAQPQKPGIFSRIVSALSE